MSPRERLNNLLAQCEKTHASDVHLAVGEIPRFRRQGLLCADTLFDPISQEQMEDLIRILSAASRPLHAPTSETLPETLLQEGSLDGAYTSPNQVRYRFNIFYEKGLPALALRQLEATFRTLDELHLPPQLAQFCTLSDGLVIVTGPTGSGKSTTLATLIHQINRTRAAHIITLEDPIEYIHASLKCLVHQRQIGRDAKSFPQALKEALRQDPDVILVGEVRDLETIRTAISAAETGHLVFATLHAGDCAGAIERLISVFPGEEQNAMRHQLALVLRGIFAQHLLPTRTGSRRVASELLFNTSACANLIATGRSAQIYSLLETGQKLGMRTLDQSLAALVQEGLITREVALAYAHNGSDLAPRLRLQKESS